jgi:hypothetical protein
MRYRSVVTSTGEVRVRSSAWAKNRRAASPFRRGERKTSMTWPNWSMARNRYRHLPPTFQVGLIDMPAIPDTVLSSPSHLGELRGEPLDPPVDAHVVDLDASLGQELFDVPVGQAEPQVPPDGKGDDLGREPVSGEGRACSWSGARVRA